MRFPTLLLILVLGAIFTLFVGAVDPVEPKNLIKNPDFLEKIDAQHPAEYLLSGDATYRYLADPSREVANWGVALQSAKPGSAGTVSQVVTGLDPKAGRRLRFTLRGLPQDGFAVAQNNLYLRVEFFGDGGKTSYDSKAKLLYPVVEQYRKDFSTNGDRHVGGAMVWRTYELDFYLPFPQVDSLKIDVGFGNGNGAARASDFYVTAFSLQRIPTPEGGEPTAKPTFTVKPSGNLLPLGGRWYYQAQDGETQPPKIFDDSIGDRLLYHDANWSAPFAGNMAAWLRAGDKDIQGNVATTDKLIADNVTIEFDSDNLIFHTHALPNHPTHKYPSNDFGEGGNPSYIQEHNKTYYIPLNPKVNASHIVTTTDNSNHALPMGPIGIAVNGVVFFNPFDANSMDAFSLLDRCCGHPAPDNTYHYHKYPICLNSPWADEGAEHSPLIGFAFDGFPIYGPYESKNLMAKDVTGPTALNDFNLHFDKDRGWHYHVTPGKFPYIIGGYWGTENSKDKHSGPPGGGMGGPGGRRRMGPPGDPPGGGPPGGGFGGPPDGN
jgi:hypothetical protein